MSRSWRGGYSNRRPYNSGPRGNGGGYPQQRPTRWGIADQRPSWSNSDYSEQQKYGVPPPPLSSMPVYLNPGIPTGGFWQGYNQQQDYTQDYHPQYDDMNQISSYRNYEYPNNNNIRFNNFAAPNNNNNTFSSQNNTPQLNNHYNCNDGRKNGQPSNEPRSSPSNQNADTSQAKHQEAEESAVVLPGSEAAREKERLEIAERLKQMNKKTDEKRDDDQINGASNKPDLKKISPSSKYVNQQQNCTNNKPVVHTSPVGKKQQQKLQQQKPQQQKPQQQKPQQQNNKNTKKKTPVVNNKNKPHITVSKDQANKNSNNQKKANNTKKNVEQHKTVPKSSAMPPLIKSTAAKRKLPPAVSPKSAKKTAVEPQKKNQASTSESTEEFKTKILSRLLAMGKDQLRSLVNNPKSPKSQEMMKNLMKLYQESKAVELDKRRFCIASSSSSDTLVIRDHTQSPVNADALCPNFIDLQSIEMSDLPLEIVSQIETFLGCNLSVPPPVTQNFDMNFQTQRSDFSHQQFQQNSFTLPNNQKCPTPNLDPLNNMIFNQPPPPIINFNNSSNNSFFPNPNPNRELPNDWISLQGSSTKPQALLPDQFLNTLESFDFPQPRSQRALSEETQRAPPDNVSESSTEKAPSPFSHEVFDEGPSQNTQDINIPPYFNPTLPHDNYNDDETPFHILRELSIIDLRIQTDIQRKMQLYKELHLYLERNKRVPHDKRLTVRSLEQEPRNQNEAYPNTIPYSDHTLPLPNSDNNCGGTIRVNPGPDSAGVSSTFESIPSTSQSLPSQAAFTQESRPFAVHVQSKPAGPEIVTIDDDENTASIVVTTKRAGKQKSASESSVVSSSGAICPTCRPLNQVPERVEFAIPQNTNINDMRIVNDSTVVVACEDTVAYAYDMNTGECTHKFRGHAAMVTAVLPVKKIGDNGSELRGEFMLCTGSMDEKLRLFDSKTEECVSQHYIASSVTCLESSPPHMLYIGVQCGQILKYNISSQRLLEQPLDCGSNAITAILCSREGPRKVLFVASNNTAIVMRDAQSGLLLRTFHSAPIDRSFSLVVHGNQLYSGTAKKGVPYFNLQSGVKEGELSLEGSVAHIKLYRHLLFAACYSGRVYVYDLRTRQRVMAFEGAGMSLKTVQVRNNRIITCSRTKRMLSVCFPEELVQHLRDTCVCKTG